MDLVLAKVTSQAMNYAIRSGVTITASYAIRQSTKLLYNTPPSKVREELYRLQQKLQHKIHIVSPAIDLIELIAARGNTSLESAVALVKELRLEIQYLAQRLEKANEVSVKLDRKKSGRTTHAEVQHEAELVLISKDVKTLLDRIEDAVPLMNLAITTSGASLTTQLPQTVSPSRLLQASTFLTAGDTQYSLSPDRVVQIGPTFTLSVYMLFAGHNRPQDEEELRETTWKEVMHKAQVKLRRVPLDMVINTGSGSDAMPAAEIISPTKLSAPDTNTPSSLRAASRTEEYAYQLMIVEDFEDDRVHDFSDTPGSSRPGPFDDVALAGVRETMPVHEISKIFYADTSKVLNIGGDTENNHPVLLLKRDLNAVPPRRMAERERIAPIEDDATDVEGKGEAIDPQEQQQKHVEEDHTDRRQDPWRLPPSLDPEWIAFEVFSESEASDSESEADDAAINETPKDDIDASHLTSQFSNIHLTSLSPQPPPEQPPAPTTYPKSLTSLSLLELLLRLTSLQQFQQQSHLSITDELLTFFLEESASTGAGGDERYRQQLRQDARRRVGWDVYDESPVKRRGEEYQYGYGDYESPVAVRNGNGNGWSPATPRSGEGSGRRNESGSGRGNRGEMFSQIPSPSPSPSPSPAPNSPLATTPGKAGRAGWLRREGEGGRKGSPLRPSPPLTDEGIGTSPPSRDV